MMMEYKSNGRVVESCDVTFDKNDRPLEERSASCEKGDAIPPDAVGRMGVGIADLKSYLLQVPGKDQVSPM